MKSESAKRSRIFNTFYRNGPSHRDGADVSFNDILKIFGFRTAEVGAWVTKEEQQAAANLFFDAFCDLMAILNVPEKVISLNGTLSIAFGKGGQKDCSAHYNSRTRTLALAKNAGAGSLAHEWFHSFDHFIASKLFKHSSPGSFASELWLKHHQIVEHPLNNLLENCFQHIFLQQNSDQPSQLFSRSVEADRVLKIYYYALPPEICARAFESFIQDNRIKNAFLVQGTKNTTEAHLGIYPVDEHRLTIARHFMKYFSTLGKALDNRL